MAVCACNMPYMAFTPTPTDHCSLKRYATLGTKDKPSEAGVLREVAPGPVVVVIDRQAEVAVLAEADAPVVIQFMADEEAATGNRVEGVATASCP